MYQANDQKAAIRRQSALVIAIGLHLALLAALFFSTVSKSVNSPLTSSENLEKSHPAPQAKAVNLP